MKAIIFDMDGVLINSEDLWTRSRAILLARRGLELKNFDKSKSMGLSAYDSARQLKEQFKLAESVEKIIEERIAIQKELYEKELQLNHGVKDVLSKLKPKYRLALATSSPKALTNFVLQKFKLKEYFDVIVCGDELKQGKPDPEIFIRTANKLAVHPSECAAVEDSLNGLYAARAAGMYTIALRNKYLPKTAQADAFINSLKELPQVIG